MSGWNGFHIKVAAFWNKNPSGANAKNLRLDIRKISEFFIGQNLLRGLRRNLFTGDGEHSRDDCSSSSPCGAL
jgi:hypothetical protein